MQQLRAVADDDLQAGVVEAVAVGHVEVLEVQLPGVQHGLRGLWARFLGHVYAGDFMTTCQPPNKILANKQFSIKSKYTA